MITVGGRALTGLGALPGYQPLSNSECRQVQCRRQTVGDKFHRREGKNPERQLRSQILSSVVKDVDLHRQPGGWLRSSHPLKKA
jgi:hypothetical protein